jgi:hypothetical protein
MIGNGSLHGRKPCPCPLVGNFLLPGRYDYRIRAWEYRRLIACGKPSNSVRRLTIRRAHRGDESAQIRLSDLGTLDYQPVPDFGLHP